MENKKTYKEVKETLWKKGYFVKGYVDSGGIKRYRVWQMKPAKLIKPFISLKDLKKLKL